MATIVTNLTDDERFSNLTPIPDRRYSDRRKEIRMASRSGLATLSVAARTPVDVQVRDVSRTGLGLMSPCPVLVGSNVVVICGGLTINGVVRHCKERVSGEYSAGISITRIVDTGAGREI
jgi:hypothetical protein